MILHFCVHRFFCLSDNLIPFCSSSPSHRRCPRLESSMTFTIHALICSSNVGLLSPLSSTSFYLLLWNDRRRKKSHLLRQTLIPTEPSWIEQLKMLEQFWNVSSDLQRICQVANLQKENINLPLCASISSIKLTPFTVKGLI